jgi:hypothetical protein
MSGMWRVDPQHERASRPADCYDVLDENDEDVICSITHLEATLIVEAHNAAMDGRTLS